jgi:hypothetical protein
MVMWLHACLFVATSRAHIIATVFHEVECVLYHQLQRIAATPCFVSGHGHSARRLIQLTQSRQSQRFPPFHCRLGVKRNSEALPPSIATRFGLAPTHQLRCEGEQRKPAKCGTATASVHGQRGAEKSDIQSLVGKRNVPKARFQCALWNQTPYRALWRLSSTWFVPDFSYDSYSYITQTQNV